MMISIVLYIDRTTDTINPTDEIVTYKVPASLFVDDHY